MGLKKTEAQQEEVAEATPEVKAEVKPETVAKPTASTSVEKAQAAVDKKAKAGAAAAQKAVDKTLTKGKEMAEKGKAEKGAILINTRKHTLWCAETNQAFRSGNPVILTASSKYIEAQLKHGLLEHR